MVMLEPKLKEKSWKKEFEQGICEKWKKDEAYAFVDDDKKLFSIDTPPPYVNTPIHIGHAATYSLMDMFARFRRMKGFKVLFPLGLDRNGLPIEMAAEKKFNVSLKDVSRERFIDLCKQVLEESSMASMDSFLRLGISFNSWETGNKTGDVYLTDSDEYRALTQATFIDMWQKGLIYEDERVNNYCPGCKTTIADAEIEYADLPSSLVSINFRVKHSHESIVIATTRPELVCSCSMIIFHPDDERYKHLESKTAVTPLYGKEVPIRPHPYADPTKGTGLMMMCSFGDQADIRFFREQKMQPVVSINQDGRMNRSAGFLEGLLVKEARDKMKEKLKEKGFVVDEKKLTHRTPICERSKHPIEFIHMKEFYLKQLDFIGNIRDISKKINFFSPHSRQILLDWLDSVTLDWAVSRRRYYATEIPLWYCNSCKETIVPQKGNYYKPWKEKPPVEKCKCGSSDFRGEERVLDTWFDSSISPLYIMKYGTKFFENNTPCSLRPQGKEIIRTWLYYTLLRCYLLTGSSIFKDVWINYHILDDKGKKMSKSAGNVIDPHKILERYGAEPFRLWCAVEGNLADSDLKCSFEHIEGAAKTITKLWNVARFISMFEMPDLGLQNVICETDKAIINELAEITDLADDYYMKYDFHSPAARIKNFLWEAFASHYMEIVKPRTYNQDKKFTKEEQLSALFTLHYCLKTLLKLLAPIIPMATYRIYNDLYGGDIHTEEFPKAGKEFLASFTISDLSELNSTIWKAKKDKQLSLKSPIKSLTISNKFFQAEKDMIAAHNTEKIEYGDETEVEL